MTSVPCPVSTVVFESFEFGFLCWNEDLIARELLRSVFPITSRATRRESARRRESAARIRRVRSER